MACFKGQWESVLKQISSLEEKQAENKKVLAEWNASREECEANWLEGIVYSIFHSQSNARSGMKW